MRIAWLAVLGDKEDDWVKGWVFRSGCARSSPKFGHSICLEAGMAAAKPNTAGETQGHGEVYLKSVHDGKAYKTRQNIAKGDAPLHLKAHRTVHYTMCQWLFNGMVCALGGKVTTTAGWCVKSALAITSTRTPRKIIVYTERAGWSRTSTGSRDLEGTSHLGGKAPGSKSSANLIHGHLHNSQRLRQLKCNCNASNRLGEHRDWSNIY